ncbi:hypothetical protein [Bacillus sp. AK031]
MSKKKVDIEAEVEAAEEKPKHSVWDSFWRGAPKAEQEDVEAEEKEEDDSKPGFRWF